MVRTTLQAMEEMAAKKDQVRPTDGGETPELVGRIVQRADSRDPNIYSLADIAVYAAQPLLAENAALEKENQRLREKVGEIKYVMRELLIRGVKRKVWGPEDLPSVNEARAIVREETSNG